MNGETRRPLVIVGAGPMRADLRDAWSAQSEVAGMVRLEHAAPSGRRFGSRALGLGVDAVRCAVKAVVLHPRARFLATNPWIAVPLILMGRDVWTTGIYAEPGSRSWWLLRRVIGDRPVVSTVQTEAEAWNAAGGQCTHTLYGTSFGAGTRSIRSGPVRIFIGGTSDRDAALVSRLVASVVTDPDVELVVATGVARPGSVPEPRVQYPGWVSQTAFVELIRESDVVFLPLRAGTRAAGHMVAVAALESGVPVVTTPSLGMQGYVDGDAVTEVHPEQDLLSALVQAAVDGRRRGPAPFRARWRSHHSPHRNIRAVLEGLRSVETLSR